MVVDISERKRMEEARSRLAAIIESSDDAIVSKDLTGVIRTWNAGAERLFGYTAAEAIGRSITMLIPPAQFDEEPFILERIRRGERIEHYETVRRRKDGRLVNVSLTVSPIVNENGDIAGASKIARDISERKRAELDIQSLLRISQELNSTLDTNRLLDSLVLGALQLVGAESGCAGLRTPEGMVCHKYFQRGTILPLEYCWPPGDGLPGWLIEHKVPYLTNDALSDKQIVHELCEQFGVWSALSTPILSAGGDVLGFFELHNRKDGMGFTQADQDKLVVVSHAASIAIQNATAYQNIKQTKEALRQSEERLEAELADTKLLQSISASLIHEDNVQALYGHILDAAVEIMHADYGSIQMFYPDRGEKGELRLLGHRGFSSEAAALWACVGATTSMSSCATATRALRRVVVPDVEKCDFMAGSRDLTGYREAGIQAMQSTPLISRGGKLLGMISTHWRRPHQPSEQKLRFFDVLARQAADLIERSRSEAERANARQTAELLNRIGPAINTELDPQKLTQTITDLATALTGAQFGAFFYNVTDDEGESYRLYTLSGAPREAFARFPQPRNTAIFGSTFRGEGIVRSDDITRDPRYGKNPPYDGMPAGHLPVRSYLAAPVVSRFGQVLGGLFFGHEKTGIFTEQHEQIIRGIAGQAAIALDNARLFAETKRNQEELSRTNSELRRANADLEQFAYSASHDLQEPIRNISIYGEILNRRYGQALDAQGLEYLSFIATGARRMEMLVKDLLAYAQSADAEGAPKDNVDATAALERALSNLSAAIEESNAEVTYDKLPRLRVLELQLEHLFQNLIGNAIKYRKDDEPPRIHLAAERNGDYWLFSVRDNGIGIPPEYKDRVFGLFKRLHRDGKYSGTGIGLAICQKVVERNGGRIWVESEGAGRGSTFHFTLPAGEAE